MRYPNPCRIAEEMENQKTVHADIWANKKKTKFSVEEAKKIGNEIGINWNQINAEQFRLGLEVEMEHGTIDPQTNVTDDDPVKTGKIALIHLKELSDYYTRLDSLEKEGEAAAETSVESE